MEPEDLFRPEEKEKDRLIEQLSVYNSTFHHHTDASLGDGITTAEQLARRAKEIGASAIGITDHGVCANWLDFYNAAKKEGIKPVLGVEAYIKNSEGRYNHLILLAKNYEGYKEISDFVSQTEAHREAMRTKEIPVGTEDMLDIVSHGNVICTSACIQGPVADPFMDRQRADREVEKIKRQKDKVIVPAGYDEAVRKKKEINSEINRCISALKQAREVSRMPSYKKQEARIRKDDKGRPDKLAYELAQLEAEKRQRQEAADRAKDAIPEIEKRRDGLKKQLTEKDPDTGLSITEIVKKGDERKKRLLELDRKIKEINAGRKPVEQARNEAKAIAARYKDRFGSDFYMEMQSHGIEAESYVYPEEAHIAAELGIPLIAANDSHIPTKDMAEARSIVQNNRFMNEKSYKEPAPGDEELYIKTGAELAEALLDILSPEQVTEAMENTAEVEKQIEDFEIPKQKAYPEIRDAEKILRKLCEEGIKKRFPDGFTQEYRDRMEYELGIIEKMGFSSYFVLIQDVVSACKDEGKKRGEMWIGPGRGSGAGSLVNYLIGNTELDPIEHGLIFERFLNPERVSMPDIDTDFSEDARKFAINYVKEKYGVDAVASIMTKTKIGLKSAIDITSKLLGIKEHGDKRIYRDTAAAIKKELDSAGIDNAVDAADYFLKKEETSGATGDKSEKVRVINEILRLSSMIEGLIVAYGQHAAGVIIVPKGDKVRSYIPEMAVTDAAGNKGFAIQADMIQAEAQIGFIKFDFLGLSNLDVISKTMHLMKERYGIDLDPYDIPVEEDVIKKIFQTRDTNFVFQFESAGMKDMLSKLKPETFDDLVLAVSVFRPGPMDFIPSIIESKNTGKPSEIVEKIPMLKDVLAETYGYPVYQEQVMRIMTDCAGFTMGEADNVRRAMSKKHEDELAAAKPKFVAGSVKNGISEKDAAWLFDQLMPFAKYGFNKSHAASYSLVSYITAYLKEHYFREYVCGTMTKQGDKIPQLIEDCRRRGVKIQLPDINISDVDFRPLGKSSIIYGLSNIQDVKGAAAKIVAEREKNGPYKTMGDFIERVNPDTGVMTALAASGAFSSLCKDRNQALDLASRYKENYAALVKKRSAAEKARENYEVEKNSSRPDEKKLKSLRARIEKTRSDEEIAESSFHMTLEPNRRMRSGTKTNLSNEMKYLKGWISGSPLDDYSVRGYDTAICEQGHRDIAGVVSAFRETVVKKTGEKMCMFTLTDKNSDSIRVTIWPKNYKRLMGRIKDGDVICTSGSVEPDTWSSNDTDTAGRKMKMIADDISALTEKQETVMISVNTESDRLEKLSPILKGYKNAEKGIPCRIFVEQSQEMYVYKAAVDRSVLNRIGEWGKADIVKAEPIPGAYIGEGQREEKQKTRQETLETSEKEEPAAGTEDRDTVDITDPQ